MATLRSNVGRVVTQYQVAELLGEAYGRAATIETAVNGFRSSGLWPVNRHLFKDSDFAASNALTPKSTQTTTVDNNVSKDRDQNSSDEFSEDDNIPLRVPRGFSAPLPLIDEPATDLAVASTSNETTFFSASLNEIAPLPTSLEAVPAKRSRGIQKATEITSTPYKDTVEANAEQKRKKVKVSLKGLGNIKSTTIATNSESKGSGKGKSTVFVTNQKSKCGGTEKSTTITTNPETNGWYCKECGVEEQSDMIQCLQCKVWMHCKCVGVGACQKKFFCASCIE